MSVPNQITVKIQKPRYKDNFLQIAKDEWIHAAKIFPPATFKLYLYLAGNADEFNLELSQKAVENAIEIKKTAYHDGIVQLKEAGYLKQLKGNIWTFSPEIPKEQKIKADSANANAESQLEVNVSKQAFDDFFANAETKLTHKTANENYFSASADRFSEFENSSSARAVEKQIIDKYIKNKEDKKCDEVGQSYKNPIDITKEEAREYFENPYLSMVETREKGVFYTGNKFVRIIDWEDKK